MNTRFFKICALVGALAAAQGVQADMTSTITLSTDSSDETPAEWLDATLEFSIAGNVLTLEVFNDTTSPYDYDIMAVYFNATDYVLELDVPTSGWDLYIDDGSMQETVADGFGRFDFALIDGVGVDPAQILPGQSLGFEFLITDGPAGGYSATDFTTVFSVVPPGERPAIAAAKFVEGPGDDSAYGAYVPAPGAALLGIVGVGCFGAWVGRSKRRSALRNSTR